MSEIVKYYWAFWVLVTNGCVPGEILFNTPTTQEILAGEHTSYSTGENTASFEYPTSELFGNNVANSLCFGLFAALCLHNFFVFLSLRDKTYIYYVVYILFAGFSMACWQRYALEFHFPQIPVPDNLNFAIASTIIFLMLLTRSFLNDKGTGIFKWLYRGFMGVSGAGILTTLLGRESEVFAVLMAAVVLTVPFVVIVSFLRWKSGFKPARFYLVGFLSLSSGMAVFILKDQDLIQSNSFTEYAMTIGSALEAIILSFALADKFNLAEKEKEKNRAKAMRRAGEFSKRLIANQEKERKLIARALHDSVGQNLSILKNTVSLLKQSARKPQAYEEINETLSLTIEEVRNISYGLLPFHLDLLGLRKSLESLLDEANGACNIHFQAEIGDIDEHLSKKLKIHVYRIVQECFYAIHNQSHVRHVYVRIGYADNLLTLLFRDDGVGIQQGQKIVGRGLMGIRERVNILGGSFGIKNLSPKGTEISITIPTGKYV